MYIGAQLPLDAHAAAYCKYSKQHHCHFIKHNISRYRNDKILPEMLCFAVKNPQADLTWQKGAKRQMANLERFIEELMSFDDNVLPEATLNLVEPYLKKPSFDPETMERKTENKACGSLCKWVRGVCRYGNINECYVIFRISFSVTCFLRDMWIKSREMGR